MLFSICVAIAGYQFALVFLTNINELNNNKLHPSLPSNLFAILCAVVHTTEMGFYDIVNICK